MNDKNKDFIAKADEFYVSDSLSFNETFDKLQEDMSKWKDIYSSLVDMGDIYKHKAFKNFEFSEENFMFNKELFNTKCPFFGMSIGKYDIPGHYILTVKILLNNQGLDIGIHKGHGRSVTTISLDENKVRVNEYPYGAYYSINNHKPSAEFIFTYDQLKQIPYEEFRLHNESYFLYFKATDDPYSACKFAANYLRSKEFAPFIDKITDFVVNFDKIEKRFYEEAECYLVLKKGSASLERE